jgi:hypothetical protein
MLFRKDCKCHKNFKKRHLKSIQDFGSNLIVFIFPSVSIFSRASRVKFGGKKAADFSPSACAAETLFYLIH